MTTGSPSAAHAAGGVLAVITARGGSKGVPRKNLRMLAGKPLIAWTIEAALAARDRLDRIVVSTDDEEIASVARQWGAEVPFLRPAALARDDTPSLPVIQHAVGHVEREEGRRIDWVLLLQPTSPARTEEDIRAALDLALAGPCDSVVSVSPVADSHPMLMKTITDGWLSPYGDAPMEGIRRQDFKPDLYINNGAVYVTRRDVIMIENSIAGRHARAYIMPHARSIDIDSEFDLKVAELVLAERLAEGGT